ncbi:serine carboxypeptidase-like 32 isoform X2 [Cryptomeria japonica]|uniref:serine carboxypeptidase-like 32 isoform X2 n=1 Tax=Cryptomeria japonica TaxID=3369 RepID=UPI0025AD6C73|nr:serine carboxypeptidase-like 32 isoform X2 [Cryptomeria japonica]
MANYLTLWVFLAFCMITVVQSTDSGFTLKSGKNPNLVTNLPGQPKVGFNHYSGYVTVNEEHGRALFYWFYEAATLKEKRPLVLWLNGGPGCSSVGYGATQEIGPFIINSDGKTLSFNEHSWNKEANMLFLESPVGVGFSYSNKTSDYKILGDNITAEDSYKFLQNWFAIYPQYRTHEFYIAGESYGGKYVPELAELIHDKNKMSSKSHYINLKGFMVGNPETHDANDWRGQMDYAWSHAVVSDETHKMILDYCDFDANNTFDNQNCTDAVDEVFAQYDKIDMYSLYTPKCIHKNITKHAKHGGNLFKYSTHKTMRKRVGGYDPCLDDYAAVYYNRYDVQKALHVLNGSHLRNWSICNYDIFNGWNYSRPSVLPAYHKLMKAGLRIWVYSGDTDGRVPVLSTRYSLNALQVPKSAWRPWYYQDQVGGWTQDYGKLTFFTVRGAGHAVPLFDRGEALFFFTSFLSGKVLPKQ